MKYPNVKVQLVGEDGNAFYILGRVTGALRKAGVPQSEIDEFVTEATDGDYDHLLSTALRWVDGTGRGPADCEDDDDYDDNPYDDDRCDRCSDPVANGHGEYPEDGTGDRICGECMTKVTA